MDTKHLKRRARSGNWYFQLAVPADLQRRIGAKVITRSLGTSSLREAQRLRHEHYAREMARFDALRADRLTEGDLRRQTVALYRRTIEAYRQKGIQQYGLEEAIDNLQDALRHGQFELAQDDMAVVPSDPRDYARLARGLLRAELEAFYAISEAENGATLPPLPEFLAPMAPVPRRGQTEGPEGPRLQEAAQRFLEARQRDPGEALTEQTASQMRTTYRLLGDYTQDAHLGEIDRGTASGFIGTLGRLGRTFGKSPADRGLSLEDLLLKYGDAGAKLSNRTLARHAAACRSLWKHAIGHGWVTGENPWSGLSVGNGKRRADKSGYAVPTDDEARRLIEAASMPGMAAPTKHSVATAMAWLVPIAFLSGLRAEEAAGLRVDDVREVDGALVFDINAEHRPLKTRNAARMVPVHPALIGMGLDRYLEHVRKGSHESLWPGLVPGGHDDKLADAVGKRFLRLRRSLGINRPGFARHSARKWFTTAMHHAGVPEPTIKALLGHERGITLGVYSGGPSMSQLKDAVASVGWPPAQSSAAASPPRGQSE